VGMTTAGMICVSPRRYPVMTGRLQVKQQKCPFEMTPAQFCASPIDSAPRRRAMGRSVRSLPLNEIVREGPPLSASECNDRRLWGRKAHPCENVR
jgi:hypothetical protein